MDFCSTCATVLPSLALSAEQIPNDRIVSCCGRTICGNCIQKNARFAAYCPYCQVSDGPSLLPQRLRDPPSYTATRSSSTHGDGDTCAPPPYSATLDKTENPVEWKKQRIGSDEKGPAEDTLHFLNHEYDTITALSFRYGVPAAALRRANNITSDHLLLGRKTISIPGRYYHGGVSLSPQPINGEEEELRKAKIRRFMTSCKVSDYDVAVLYLEQSGYDLGASTEAYVGDEAWERGHSTAALDKTAVKGQNRSPFWRGISRHR